MRATSATVRSPPLTVPGFSLTGDGIRSFSFFDPTEKRSFITASGSLWTETQEPISPKKHHVLKVYIQGIIKIPFSDFLPLLHYGRRKGELFRERGSEVEVRGRRERLEETVVGGSWSCVTFTANGNKLEGENALDDEIHVEKWQQKTEKWIELWKWGRFWGGFWKRSNCVCVKRTWLWVLPWKVELLEFIIWRLFFSD